LEIGLGFWKLGNDCNFISTTNVDVGFPNEVGNPTYKPSSYTKRDNKNSN